MRGFLAVLWLELRERRLLPLAGLLVGAVPLLVPVVLPAHRDSASMEATAIALFVGMIYLLAVIFGASLFGRDLAERRLGFLFARPVAGLGIWLGRYLAALILIALAGALVLAPTALRLGGFPDFFPGYEKLSGPLLRSGSILSVPFPIRAFLFLVDRPAVFAGAFVVFLMGLAHAARLAWIGRSAWLLVDLAALIGSVGWLWWWLWMPLMSAGAWGSTAIVNSILFLAALLALTLAWSIQIVRHRTRVRAGQRSLSTVFWSVMLATFLALTGFQQWTLSAGPRDLEALTQTHTDGRYLVFSGLARDRPGYFPLFLTDLEGGDSWNLSTGKLRSGQLAEWQGGEIEAPRSAFPVLFRIGVSFGHAWPLGRIWGPAELRGNRTSRVSVSRDGELAAFTDRERLLVVETGGDQRIVASAPFSGPLWRRHEIAFLDRRTVRVAETVFEDEAPEEGRLNRYRIRVRDLDIERGAVRETLDFEVTGHRYRGFPSPDRRSLLLAAPTSLLLVDLDSGSSRELPFEPVGFVFGAAFLANGDVAVAKATGQTRSSMFVVADGTQTFEIDLPGFPSEIAFGGQPAPGLLLIGERSRDFGKDEHLLNRFRGASSWRTSVIDLESRTVREVGTGLRPVAQPDVEAGSAGSRLLQRGEAEFVLWDPATGDLEPLFEP